MLRQQTIKHTKKNQNMNSYFTNLKMNTLIKDTIVLKPLNQQNKIPHTFTINTHMFWEAVTPEVQDTHVPRETR
jgi:hypothetical protein